MIVQRYFLVTYIGSDLAPVFTVSKNQLKPRISTSAFFSLAVYDCADILVTVQLLIFVRGLRGIDYEFNVTEELASMTSLHDRSTGKNIFDTIEP